MAKQTKKQVSPHTAVWVDQEDKTMNDAKQSSVEWLVEQLKPAITLQEKYINEFLERAKKMHKEEVEEAYGHGQNNGYMYAHQKAITISKENYFNQTFGGQDNE